ncbi:hypothetical protein KHQ81_02925 [Mycoplasmatota bacterium]|nr:hypothetical protein KHQ81_02925 [Mycoplasmatota bacterium]
MKQIRIINLHMGLLLLMLLSYMIFFVKYPIEDSMEVTMAKNIYDSYKNSFSLSSIDINNMIGLILFLILISMPFLLLIMALFNKNFMLLLSIFTLLSLLMVFIILINIGNIGNIGYIGDQFNPHIILCSLIFIVIIVQFILNLKYYLINKRNLKENI